SRMVVARAVGLDVRLRVPRWLELLSRVQRSLVEPVRGRKKVRPDLLALDPALWLFAALEGGEPTNNHAERLLRSGVLWRKNAFGCPSAAGCRLVERMLTVVQTLRLQNRPVWDDRVEAIAAHRSSRLAPQLLGQAGD